MKIPFLDLKAQANSIKEEINIAINNVIEKTAFASGPFVEEFEDSFKEYTNTKYCIAVNSGTSALHLALLALNINKDDEIILPAHSFVSTAWAISYIGAKPVFVDIDPITYTIDPNRIEATINSKTKAIIPVHLYGQSANMDAILDIAKKHNLRIIEDAAQAHGAKYKNKQIGSIGDIACFSFYPGKNLGAFGEGGAITTNNPNLAERCKLLRNHAQPEKYIHTEVGYNYRMDGIQGAVLKVKMNYIRKWTEKRIEIARKYSSSLPQERIVKFNNDGSHVFHLYELKCDSKQHREKLMMSLNEKGISTGLHYPIPMHLQEAYKHLDHKKGDFPNTEMAAECLLSLPLYPEMTDDMVEYVIKSLNELL